MTYRERAHTHLENARTLYQESGMRTGSKIDLLMATLLSVLEEVSDREQLEKLQALHMAAERVRAGRCDRCPEVSLN